MPRWGPTANSFATASTDAGGDRSAVGHPRGDPGDDALPECHVRSRGDRFGLVRVQPAPLVVAGLEDAGTRRRAPIDDGHVPVVESYLGVRARHVADGQVGRPGHAPSDG